MMDSENNNSRLLLVDSFLDNRVESSSQLEQSIELQSNMAYTIRPIVQPSPQDSESVVSQGPDVSESIIFNLSVNTDNNITICNNEAYSVGIVSTNSVNSPINSENTEVQQSEYVDMTSDVSTRSQSYNLLFDTNQDIDEDQLDYVPMDAETQNDETYESLDTQDETYEDMEPDVSNSEIYSSIHVNTSEPPPPSYEQLNQVDPSTYYSSITANNRNQEYLRMLPPQNRGQLTSTEIPMHNSVISNQGLYYVQPLQPHFQYRPPHYAPVQTQPAAVPLNPAVVGRPYQQQIIDERNEVNCFTSECFAHLSLSIILIIIFFIFGGPLTLALTVPALIVLIIAERKVYAKRKHYRQYGYIMHLAGCIVAIVAMPVWGCGITLIVIFGCLL